MTTRKSGIRSSAKKGSAATETVEEYVARVPETTRRAFTQLRNAVRSAVPADAVEVISYRIPAIKRGKVLVWYAAFSNHCSLFPTASIIQAFKDELKDFSQSKGTIQFPADKPIPTALVKKLVKARVAQVKGS